MDESNVTRGLMEFCMALYLILLCITEVGMEWELFYIGIYFYTQITFVMLCLHQKYCLNLEATNKYY